MLVSAKLTALFMLTVLLAVWFLLSIVKRTAPQWTVRTAIGLLLWLAGVTVLGMSGYLANEDSFPPRILQLMLFATVGAAMLSVSSFGDKLAAEAPMHLLAGLQTYRMLLAIVLFFGFGEGFVPWQFTLRGLNWDALAGMGALMMMRIVKRDPGVRAPLWIWSSVGIMLLIHCGFLIAFSVPTPFTVFAAQPGVDFLYRSPYIWWPLFLMPLSIFGHIVILRRLWAGAPAQVAASTPA